jgi:heme oxygenase (mycobilin-producing)
MLRIVRLRFRPEEVGAFMLIWEGSKRGIRGMEGCQSVKLMRDTTDASVFYTVSEWKNEAALDAYRKSELFGKVWPATKALFAEPAQTFSLQMQDESQSENMVDKGRVSVSK